MSSKNDAKGPKGKPRFSEGATIADSMRVPDPLLDKMGSFFADVERLPAMRKNLAKCRVVHNNTKVTFENFINNTRGMGRFKLGEIDFFSFRTRTGAFLLCNECAENLYEVCPAVTGVELKNRLILERPDGKHLYLYLVTTKAIETLHMLGSAQQPKKEAKPDTLVHDASGGHYVEEGEFTAKLRKCTYLKGTTEAFDFNAFVESLQFVTAYEDSNGNVYYYIVAGEENDGYRLYVNCGTHDLDYFESMHILSYGKDMCRLFKED